MLYHIYSALFVPPQTTHSRGNFNEIVRITNVFGQLATEVARGGRAAAVNV